MPPNKKAAPKKDRRIALVITEAVQLNYLREFTAAAADVLRQEALMEADVLATHWARFNSWCCGRPRYPT